MVVFPACSAPLETPLLRTNRRGDTAGTRFASDVATILTATRHERNCSMTTSAETNQSFYDRISQAYDLIANAGEHKAREAGEAALAVAEGERVLEIGFGTGNSILSLAASSGESGHVSGIDVSPGMLRVAEKKIAEKGQQGQVDLNIGDARELPYPDGSFDAAFASFTLELFPLDDIPQVTAEVFRVLKAGGRFGVVSMATVKEGVTPSALERTYVWMHRHFPHIVDCQPIDVAAVLSEAGFQIQQETEMEIWTMPVRAIIALRP